MIINSLENGIPLEYVKPLRTVQNGLGNEPAYGPAWKHLKSSDLDTEIGKQGDRKLAVGGQSLSPIARSIRNEAHLSGSR